jgi:hypothetical protein
MRANRTILEVGHFSGFTAGVEGFESIADSLQFGI